MARLLILLGLVSAVGCATYEDQLRVSQRCQEYFEVRQARGEQYQACDEGHRSSRVGCGQ